MKLRKDKDLKLLVIIQIENDYFCLLYTKLKRIYRICFQMLCVGKMQCFTLWKDLKF
jgi:hypothetical protein